MERANEADLASGEGSRIWGGRWNPQGSFRTVYLSLHYATAMEEYLAGNRRSGLPDSQAMPSVTIGVRLDLVRVLDLTQGEIRRILKVSLKRMVNEPHGIGPIESRTQAIGRLAWSECYEGVLVPSAACPTEKNIVVFPGKLSSGQMVPIHAGRLPPRTS
jgi:RES domain-containing protein